LALDLGQVHRWRHDKVLCLEHATALDAVLSPGSGAAAPAIMTAMSEGSA
jgi:hypothetical protein